MVPTLVYSLCPAVETLSDRFGHRLPMYFHGCTRAGILRVLRC